jgi:hypothetical protein
VIGGNADLCSTIPQSLGEAESSEPSEKTDHKVVAFSGWAPYLVVLGSVLDVLSTFFPWSELVFGLPAFLPFSVPLPLGWSVFFLESNFYTVAVNVMVRLASILGFAGLLVRRRVGNASSNWVQCVSIGLSFAAIGVFSRLEMDFSYGVYIVLVAGILKLVGVIGQNVEMELVSEGSD